MWLVPVIMVAGLYAALLLLFACGWKRLPEPAEPRADARRPGIAVVVACRNEAEHLPALLDSLSRQTLPPAEIIFVDDHSTDGTLRLLEAYARHCPNARVLSAAGGPSKKNALAEAIRTAASEMVLCTDADCTVPETWVETVAKACAAQPADLLILPVSMQGKGFFSRLQQMEFATLIASGASMAAWQRPIMCNGANLAFRRQEWLAAQSDLHAELPSGDDMFLLHSFKKRGLRIRFLKDRRAMVDTLPADSLRVFIRQRSRWTSKAGHYTDADTIAVALMVLAANMLWLALLAGAFFCREAAWAWGAFFGLKWLLDGLFLKLAQPFFQYRHVAALSFVLSLIYPFYVAASVVGACLPRKQGKGSGFA